MDRQNQIIPVQVDKPYQVTVGWNLLERLEVPHKRVALIYDSGLPSSLVERVSSQVELALPLPSGEACKTLEVHARVLSQLAKHAFPRDAAIVALGGGATSDLAGYVAASYLRGVAFYNLPTSLLGMVDASVGGKTGVNLPEGKNLVGAFHQPNAVWADLETLRSLPKTVWKEGMAEMFKHGLLERDAALPRFFEKADLKRPDFLQTLARSIQVKADIVARDPFEAGERAHLNLGHTLGHALEWASHHGPSQAGLSHTGLSHGEAIGYGLHYAAILSRLENGADWSGQTLEFLDWLRPSPLPTRAFADLTPLMARDKKATSDGLKFVLLREPGQPYTAKVSLEHQEKAFEQFLNDVNTLEASPDSRFPIPHSRGPL